MNHFQSLLSLPTLPIESTTVCHPINLPKSTVTSISQSSQQQQQQQELEQQQQQQQHQEQQLQQEHHQSVIMNSSQAVVGEPSSSFTSSVPDFRGITECCPSSSPSVQIAPKKSISEDHCGEMKEMNVQKRIKRPMNAFMVWSQMRRAQIASTDVKMHNSQISKELGAEWREMSVEEKAPYVKRAKELREELMRRHPNYVYRPKRRSHGSTKNLITKSCAILQTPAGPMIPPPQVSSFEQRSHVSSIPTAHDIRQFFLARVMQEQQNNMLLAAYRNQLLAAAATTTTPTTTTPLKESPNLDSVDQEKLQSTMGNFTTGRATTGNVPMIAETFNPISSLSMLQSPYNSISPLLGSQFNPFLFS